MNQDDSKAWDLEPKQTVKTPTPLPPSLGGYIPEPHQKASQGCCQPLPANSNLQEPPSVENILAEADRLTSSARNADYGTPLDNFTQTALLINAAFGTNFTAEDIGLILILVKVSRQRNKAKRDNLTDIAGYARTIEMVEEERRRRQQPLGKLSYLDTDPVFYKLPDQR